ncbi:Crp/Fnr family transcriptional regulator [Roseofilum casamattae]|uniref:Cyclic nucleotide-binding domain-containing protein n=1 Tax=Roseofilum casamattae BLCC-M143 TaxID=3022442 RepID=A0ABT7BT58_9CYAN|nr:cyclic nucleotide-binding domain-containing protein [Roseofilum casamattae]MDJ1182365.1 cyclic nucleotide-binding domain-containing protein [Roseofilum casamattae BLCC-M143]
MNYQQFSAFNNLQPEEIKDFVRAGKPGKIAAGKPLFKQQMLSRQIVFVLEGTVQISINTPNGAEILSTIAAPTILGEIGFFSGEPSSANVTSVTSVRVLALEFETLRDRLLQGDAVAAMVLLNMSQALAKRAANMTRQLSELYAAREEIESQDSQIQQASSSIFGEWSFL